MAGRRRKGDDLRLSTARYQLGKLRAESGDDEDEPDTAGQASMDQRAQYVEVSIQQAMRRGDFEDLPGAGKPIRGLGGVNDPDWWIRRKIQREGITGLGPPALTLRTEDAGLDDRLDGLPGEAAVREALEDFNRRVVEARRQLLGGPPVVTRTRDVDAEVERWRIRAGERRRVAAAQRAEQESQDRRRRWWRRRHAV